MWTKERGGVPSALLHVHGGMILDPSTLLLTSILTFTLLAGAQVLVWAQDRREDAILWMAAASLLCNGSALLREVLPPDWAIVLANLILMAGTACIATACRSLRARPPAWTGFLLPALVWLAGCMVPAFMADQMPRVAVSSILSAALTGWAMVELWLDRHERLLSRTILLGLFAVQSLAAAIRGIVAALAVGTMRQPGVARTADMPLVTIWAFGFLFVASLGVMLLVKERSERRLRHVADQDALTGLANRRRFDQGLEAAIAAARRRRRPLAVLMVDADAFKLYNDRYGHLAGDRALQDVAGVLAGAAARVKGLAARHGGEEFVILIPEADEAEALRLAEAIRHGLETLAIVHDDAPHGRLTVSIGITARSPGENTVARDYLHAADQGLYAAKRAGRNRIGCWEEAAAAAPHRAGANPLLSPS